MAARAEDLLPVEYFHVVFTLPAEIARIAYWNKKAVYGLLGPVEIHRVRIIVAPMWIMASKLVSVLQARIAIRLNSLSF